MLTPDALSLESAAGKTSLSAFRQGTDYWIPVGGPLLGALGREAGVEVDLPHVTFKRGERMLKLAIGMAHCVAVGPEGSSLIWLPEKPRLIEGALAVTPGTLACALRSLGANAAWIAPDKLLRLGPEQAAISAPAAVAKPQPLVRSVQPKPRAGPLRVVLDPGHGGADCGAYGRSGLCEKVVTLDLCKQIGDLLERKGVSVVMTRESDKYVSLEKRVEIARRADADLFLSIHVNASRDRRVHGVETYVYGREVSSARDAALVRRENADSNYVDIIVSDLHQQLYHDSSIRMAGSIEGELVRKHNLLGRGRSRVKEAPFYVLARVHKPAVLIEVGFISNAEEERKLKTRNYRQQLAKTIAAGILEMLPADAAG